MVPDAPFAVMNGTQNYLGKGWDDRVGCAVVIEAMKKLAQRAATEPDFLGGHGAGRNRTAGGAHVQPIW